MAWEPAGTAPTLPPTAPPSRAASWSRGLSSGYVQYCRVHLSVGRPDVLSVGGDKRRAGLRGGTPSCYLRPTAARGSGHSAQKGFSPTCPPSGLHAHSAPQPYSLEEVGGGGGGRQSVKKGTSWDPTPRELWPSRADITGKI